MEREYVTWTCMKDGFLIKSLFGPHSFLKNLAVIYICIFCDTLYNKLQRYLIWTLILPAYSPLSKQRTYWVLLRPVVLMLRAPKLEQLRL